MHCYNYCSVILTCTYLFSSLYNTSSKDKATTPNMDNFRSLQRKERWVAKLVARPLNTAAPLNPDSVFSQHFQNQVGNTYKQTNRLLQKCTAIRSNLQTKKGTLLYIYRCSLYKHLTLDLQTAMNMQARLSPVLSLNHPGIIHILQLDRHKKNTSKTAEQRVYFYFCILQGTGPRDKICIF